MLWDFDDQLYKFIRLCCCNDLFYETIITEENFMPPLTKYVSVLAVVLLAGGGIYYFTQQNSEDENAMTIQFRNNSWDALNSVELSPAGADTYVSIPLTDGTFAPAGVLPHTISDGRTVCNYDLRVTKVDGAVGQYENANLCAESFYFFEESGFE